MHGQDYGIFIVELETKEVVEIPLNAHEPKWSPDGEELVFHSDEHGWFDIGVFDLHTKEISWLTENVGDSQSPILVSRKVDKELEQYQFIHTQSKGAVNWIELSDAEDSRKKYQVGKGIHSGIRPVLSRAEGLASDLKRMVTTFSSPSQPPDLWMIDIKSGTSAQLTNSIPDDLSNAEFVMPEEIQYESTEGVQVPALLFRSKETPAPAVVMIHGGPNWHYSAEWNPLMAHFASRGYVLLCPNYRGSTGYGREWQYAAQFDMGGVDTRDVAAGAQYLLREGLADKIAVTGRSHGGYLTMTCLTQYPELWCAGSAVVPFTNWFKSHDDAREDLQHWNIENMGDPKENYERWYNASPYFFLDKIQAPVQMICGGNDPRCPASDSIETHDKLLVLGKSVEFLLYEDEGHAFLKIENVINSESKRVDFIARELRKDHAGHT
jgi:dipeptidyl aminopeptidase/acylaminoacyl peptidase